MQQFILAVLVICVAVSPLVTAELQCYVCGSTATTSCTTKAACPAGPSGESYCYTITSSSGKVQNCDPSGFFCSKGKWVNTMVTGGICCNGNLCNSSGNLKMGGAIVAVLVSLAALLKF